MREFLSRKGVRFTEYDVASNPAAASEMVQRSGQSGVPVTVVDGQVIVGFDRPGLERALASLKPSLGIKAADAAPKGLGAGVLVGEVHPGSAGEHAGLKPGDVIVEVEGQAVWGAADLAKAVGNRGRGNTVSLTVLRSGQRLTLKTTL